jgi:hypothetical protein
MVTSAVGEQEIPVAYLLGEQYIKAMQDRNPIMPKPWYSCRYSQYYSWCDGTKSVIIPKNASTRAIFLKRIAR